MLTAIVLIILMAPVLSFAKAFFAMLLLGAVHHEVFSWVPALGFWQTLLVVLAIAFLFPTQTSATTTK